MFKVVLKGKHSVSVKCSICKAEKEIQANRHNHPVTMAFVHPKQSVPVKCEQCGKDYAWSPEELKPLPIKPAAPAPVSFDAKDLMSAHLETTSFEPLMSQ